MKKTRKITTLFFIILTTTAMPIHILPYKIAQSTLRYFTNMTTYCYYIKCLSISIYFLSRLSQHKYQYTPCNIITYKDCIQIDSTFFFHNKIRFCLQKVLDTKSLKPIISLLQEINHNFDIHNDHLMHETFLLIFTIQKQILLHECEQNNHVLKKATHKTIMEVSEKIDQLPIAEILTIIDMLMTEIPPFLEKYELHSTLTWQKWIKKYWWVPPIFGGWFTLKILLNFQKSYFYPRYPHAKPSRFLDDDTVITDRELLKLMQKKTDQK